MAKTIRARTVVIASGAQYNKLNIDSLTKFRRPGLVYDGAMPSKPRCAEM